MKRALVVLLAIILSASRALAQQPVVTKAVDDTTKTTTDVGDATNHGIRTSVYVSGVGIDPRSIRLLTASDIVTVLQGGTFTMQPGNTPNTTPWIFKIWDAAGNARGANVTAANALVVDGSAVTQPVSGTVTANTPVAGSASTATWTSATSAPSSVTVTTDGTDVFVVQFTASGFSGSALVTFDVTADGGTTWVSVPAVRANNGAATSGGENLGAASVPAIYRLNVAGMGQARATLATNNIVGGSMSVRAYAAAAVSDPGVALITTPINVNVASGTLAVTEFNVDNSTVQMPGGITASTFFLEAGGKTNDGTPQYKPIPEGAGGRSVIVEGVAGGTAVPVSAASLPLPANAAQETGGNLATLAGTVTSARAAVNPISGQAGVQGASGITTATTQRVTLATDVALPTGSNTIGAVTQASGPWTSNVTQFGGTNISTGPGVGGAGVPRVTVSSDSTITANAGTNLNTSALALEAGGNLASIKADVDKIPSQGQAAMAASMPVVIASNQSTIPISAAALPLPSNAAQETGGNLATIVTNTTGAAKDATLTTIDTDLKATQPRDVTDRAARLLGHVSVDAMPSTSAPSVTFVGGAQNETTLLAANAARKGFVIINQSRLVMLVKCGTGIGTQSYTAAVAPGQMFSTGMAGPAICSGTITGIWFGLDGGGAVITEM